MPLQGPPEPDAETAKPAISIGAVERETGILKETLRMWERRYGFPAPARSPSGERFYSRAEVRKLHLLKFLADKGYRPGSIVGRPLAELQGLAGSAFTADRYSGLDQERMIEPVSRLIRTSRAGDFRDWLTMNPERRWAQDFILDVIRPLAAEIDQSSGSGAMPGFIERLASERLESLLRQAKAMAMPRREAPQILLTTLPGEQRRLELLMTEALFATGGAACTSLGTQTPVEEIALCARDLGSDIIVLPFGRSHSIRKAQASLRDLHAALRDEKTVIWAAGASLRRIAGRLSGIVIHPELEDGLRALAAWPRSPAPLSAAKHSG